MNKEFDYIVKTYSSESELQKHLNQWKHQFDLEIEHMSALKDGSTVYITVIIKRIKK